MKSIKSTANNLIIAYNKIEVYFTFKQNNSTYITTTCKDTKKEN